MTGPFTPQSAARLRDACRTLAALAFQLGLDPRRTFTFCRGALPYLRDLRRFRQLQRNDPAPFPMRVLFPCPGEARRDAGQAHGHYFHQDLLVAQKIHQRAPLQHVDIGSRIDGFVAHVAAFRNIEVLDVRALPLVHERIQFRQVDITSDDFDLVDYCDSVSSLHTIEHLGLGRYGDRLDPFGYLRGLRNIHRMLRKGGTFYLAVPIGEQRIEYNAHRVFSLRYLHDLVAESYAISEFAYVDDRGALHRDAPLTAEQMDRNYGCVYGCGIFDLVKR